MYIYLSIIILCVYIHRWFELARHLVLKQIREPIKVILRSRVTILNRLPPVAPAALHVLVCVMATCYTPELATVQIHWKMLLNIHWAILVEIHWTSDNPLRNM